LVEPVIFFFFLSSVTALQVYTVLIANAVHRGVVLSYLVLLPSPLY